MSTNTRLRECLFGIFTMMNVPGVNVMVLSERFVSGFGGAVWAVLTTKQHHESKESDTCCSFGETDVKNSAT